MAAVVVAAADAAVGAVGAVVTATKAVLQLMLKRRLTRH
jgi:RNase P/RNase MRP subunit p29